MTIDNDYINMLYMKRYADIMREMVDVVLDQEKLKQRPITHSQFRQIVQTVVTDVTPRYITLTCYYLNDNNEPVQNYWIPQKLTPTHDYPNTKYPLEYGEFHEEPVFDESVEMMLNDYGIPSTNQNKCTIANMASMVQMTWYAWFKIQHMMDRVRVNYLGDVVTDDTLSVSAALALNYISMKYATVSTVLVDNSAYHVLLVFALFRRTLDTVLLEYLGLNPEYFRDVVFPVPGLVGLKLLD